MKQIHIRQLIAEQTCFDEDFKGKVSEGILMKTDGTLHIQTTKKELFPLKKTNIVWVEYAQGGLKIDG